MNDADVLRRADAGDTVAEAEISDWSDERYWLACQAVDKADGLI